MAAERYCALDGMVLACGRQTKVTDLSVASHVNEDVLRLQVSVDNAMAVDV